MCFTFHPRLMICQFFRVCQNLMPVPNSPSGGDLWWKCRKKSSIDNLELLCGSCNSIKDDRCMDYLKSKLQLL